MSAVTWHKDFKSCKNINEFLFKNETMSDCSFLVEFGNEKVKIPAHKYILGGWSPEFYNLFYLMKASSDEIPIADVSVENLSSFLEFLYTEKTELTMENIEDLIKLAKRYSVESFKDFCSLFVLENVTVNNVLTVMDKYSGYELPASFETGCLKIINKNHLIFKDPSFYEISNRTLTTILKSEELKGFNETTIFEGADKWAETFCNKNNQAITSNNKRSALGSALQHIRFGAMTIPEFTSFTYLDNFLLTPKEMIEVFQFIGSGEKKNCRYSGIKRTDFELMKISLFVGPSVVLLSKCMYGISGYNLFQFSSCKPIYLHGLEIYGRGSDSLDIQHSENFLIQLKDKTGNVVCKNIAQFKHDGTTKTYEMLFQEKKLINANEEYEVYIKRQQEDSFYNYLVETECVSINKMGITINQIQRICTSIIFSVCD